MKIFALPALIPDGKEIYYDGIADSSLTPWRKPFYLPDFDSQFTMSVCPLVIISRLGKAISERFAPRYYTEGMIGILFRAAHLYSKLAKEGKPTAIATSFDSSVLVSPRMSWEELKACWTDGIRVEINGQAVASLRYEELATQMNRAVHLLSQSVTMKMGDVLCLNLPNEGIAIREGVEIQLVSEADAGQVIHKFSIK